MAGRKGLIFDVQSYSLHDGPGCRTLIFLSGCPLRCEWCSNPEGLEYKQNILYSSAKCRNRNLNCTRCIDACPYGAISVQENGDIPLKIDYKKCSECTTFECAKVCFYEAFRIAGKWMEQKEVMDLLNRDRQYWGAKGGVTFSGGEAFLQHEFLKEMLFECKKAGIHTAIETTANISTNIFMDIMPLIDFAFIDLKNMDSQKHKEKTGVGNEQILKNIKTLAGSDWPGRVCLRMPVIKDFNDSREHAIEAADFMNSIGLFEINILPFNRLGASKWEQMGKVYPYINATKTPDEKMNEIQEIFLDKGIACYKDTETYF